MQTLKTRNFSTLNIREQSQLNADATVGATSLTVSFSDDLVADNYLYLGSLGAPGGELLVVATITDADTITVDAPGTTKSHSRFEPITVLFGNQIKVYRASNVDGTAPTDASFSILATVDIDYDQVETLYTDATGGDDYWYKFTYYNEVSATETNISDATAVRGGNLGNYASIESIRVKAGLQNNQHITDALVDEKRQVAQSIINSALVGIYTIPFTAPIAPAVAEMTRLLAAGYLLTDNYGPLGTLNTNRGQSMIDRVTNSSETGILDLIRKGVSSIVGADGVSTAIPGTAGSFGGWPDTTTADADAEDGGSARAFRMSDRY